MEEPHVKIRRSRPPDGYSSMRVEPSQILLPLTISNKCGQTFRWRGVDVYEELAEDLGDVKKEVNPSTHPAPRKREQGASDADQICVKEEFIDEEPGASVTSPADSTSLPIKTETERHKQYRRTTEWSMCLPDRVVFLRQDEERGFIYHRTLLGNNASPATLQMSASDIDDGTAAWLHDYLSLGVPLTQMYEDWSARDPVFKRFAKRFTGLRMLRQDPVECLFSFICSSNNNIARIGQMVQALCTHYSDPIATVTYPLPPVDTYKFDDEVGSAPTTIAYHPFPAVERLTGEDVESTLRSLAFGYRARFIQDTALKLCDIVDNGPAVESESSRNLQKYSSVADYLDSIRKMDYRDARAHLTQLSGVGPKVADCILLMSMDQPSSIPVDRHVFQFAERWYRIRTKGGMKGYEHIADTFRSMWGEYAGWAHSVLFTADLRAFQSYKVEEKEEAVDGSIDEKFVVVKQETTRKSNGGTVQVDELVKSEPTTNGNEPHSIGAVDSESPRITRWKRRIEVEDGTTTLRDSTDSAPSARQTKREANPKRKEVEPARESSLESSFPLTKRRTSRRRATSKPFSGR